MLKLAQIATLVAFGAGTAIAASDRASGDRAPKSAGELLADLPYAPVDALGVGFSSREIGAKTYAVTVRGEAATPLNHLVSIAFARAAEIGLANRWPVFRISEMKRSSDCETWTAGGSADAPVSAGRPVLTITVVYGPEGSKPDDRSSEETFNEMRSRLAGATSSEQERQATINWVFEYCASTGGSVP